jgi:hypothetical protein
LDVASLGRIGTSPGGAGEEVQEDVGAGLVHGAGLPVTTETSGEVVDVIRGGGDSMRGQVHPEEVRRAVRVGLDGDTPVRH